MPVPRFSQAAYNRRYRARGRMRLLMEKADRGNRCEECGHIYHPHVLEFAHRDEHRHLKNPRLRGGRRSGNMAWLAKNDAAAFIAEVRLCRLLCANCHRMETVRGRHWVALDEVGSENPQMDLFVRSA